jgi:hypothetical protein
MSKSIGIVEVAGIKKPIQLEGINVVQFNFNNIGIAYGASNTSFQWGNQYVFIQFINPGNEVSQAFIKKQFYQWLSEGLTTSSPSILNEYLPQITITDVGVRGSIATGNIVAAADLTTACAANPNTLVALDYAGGTIPPVGTYIYDPNKNGSGLPGPIDAGTYALSYNSQQFFITVNSSSLISSIEICPLILDFVYNLQNLGAGPVFNANMDSISFSIRSFLPMGGGANYGSYYGVAGLSAEPASFNACSLANNNNIYGSTNAMWPVGILNNATSNQIDFSSLDIAFGLALADSNNADFNQAQLYVSFDYNTAGAASATFQPFLINFGQNPMFPASPGGGIPGFGDGTTSFSAGGSGNDFGSQWSSQCYLPAGNSLVGTASFTNGAFCNWDTQTGVIEFPENTNCPI